MLFFLPHPRLLKARTDRSPSPIPKVRSICILSQRLIQSGRTVAVLLLHRGEAFEKGRGEDGVGDPPVLTLRPFERALDRQAVAGSIVPAPFPRQAGLDRQRR